MPRYDLHQHLWPEAFISALSRRTKPPRLQGSRLELVDGTYDVELDDHRLERRLELLDRAGIDVACVSLQPTLGYEGETDLVEVYHDGILELVDAADGRLRALAAGERREGFAGACVSAERVLDGVGELGAELRDAGQFLFVHPGVPANTRADTPPWWSLVVDYTEQMEAAFIAWISSDGLEDVPVVFALLAGGGPFQLERLASRGAERAVQPGVYLETSSYGPRAIELCMAALGPERIVYGSDTPIGEPGPGLRALADLGDAVARMVCEQNPARLLG